MNKRSFSIGMITIGNIALLSLLALSACTTTTPPEHVEDSTIQVVATFYPLAQFAQQIGQEHIAVISLTPPGIEPHDYEPSPQDIRTILESDLFLINGQGLDSWAEGIVESNPSLRSVIITNNVTLLGTGSSDEHDDDHDEEEHDEEDDHNHDSEFDPHIWLDPLTAVEIVTQITEELKDIDPDHADTYERNAAEYITTLNQLHQEFVDGLASCKKNDILVSHAAFGYLTNRYNLTMHAIAGLSPEDDPSPRTMARLTELAREEGIDYVFFETLVSPKIAQTLAAEIGAETLTLNPLEGLTSQELEQGENYVSIMRNNLRNLRTALDCQ